MSVDRAERIKAGIGGLLRTGLGDGVQLSENLLSQPTSPGFEITIDPEGINFDQAMGRGLDEWFILVRGFVAKATDVGSQQMRDRWLVEVKRVIEVDRTLGGACQAARVISARPREYTTGTGAGSITYAGAEWRIRVMATG